MQQKKCGCPHSRRGNTAVILIVLIVVAVIIGFVVLSMGEGVGGHIDDYMAIYDNTPRGGTASEAAPQGPAVIVDYEGKKLDALNDFLPANLRADKDADVQTVIITIRASTGLPGASMGVPIASGQEGYYSIAALMYDRAGALLRAKTITKSTGITGAGAEAEAGREVTRQMADWINAQFGG